MSIGPWSTWLTEAACADHDPLLWDDSNPNGHAQARAICNDCPVQTQCLEAAAEETWATGIWGGATIRPDEDPDFGPTDLRRIPTIDGQAQPCGTDAAYARHRAHGEDPCLPCRRAHREYNNRRYHATNEENP